MPAEDIDLAVKLAIYRITADTGSIPDAAEIGTATNLPEHQVIDAFTRLHGRRLLVPEPGDQRRIRMAPPFSGIPTAFPVQALNRRYYANCVWDAYGVAAALHADAVIPAVDGHTGELLTLEVRNTRPIVQPYFAHFAVPAARWWDDIVFT